MNWIGKDMWLVLDPEDQLGVDEWVITFSSDGKQGVLEFNREGERRGQKEITVGLGSSG
jgi:hypothetical protein